MVLSSQIPSFFFLYMVICKAEFVSENPGPVREKTEDIFGCELTNFDFNDELEVVQGVKPEVEELQQR
ncbi:polyadenylate-binding protein 2-like [Pyrus ussuriensis x Pyrus communis]|uniref:Polyadenylate-binding protein 2-like n=1 Tax=Pyrus ussuriensis x Pyrus communis TaxID=2448454 RepID=A0A5N5HLF2_9ROSA|nr:polyadenylate-binding protein 2-like [Pyrus ussuriensis x Pyrus communis]KAB2628786.1 polyadenylate-binding protein 2-like [Pyrus ussuriensis x Pyrus communis]